MLMPLLRFSFRFRQGNALPVIEIWVAGNFAEGAGAASIAIWLLPP
jgi:hypothetical protein